MIFPGLSKLTRGVQRLPFFKDINLEIKKLNKRKK